MPNWCFTNISFDGPDASRFQKDLKSWMVDTVENGFGSGWLGNIAINSGLIKPEEIDGDDIPRLRGSISYVTDPKDNSFSIDTETAWCCMTRVFAEIIRKFGYDLRMTFFAEEPGCGFYVSNDPDIVGTYRYECCISGLDEDDDIQFNDDVSMDVAAELAKEILQIKKVPYSDSDTPKELISKAENVDLDDDEYVSFNQYEFCSEWEF